MDSRQLQNMYQQWMQDNEDYVRRWYDFVELVSKQYGVEMDEIIRKLQTCYWFRKGE